MMTTKFQILRLPRRYPLAISRGTQALAENLFVSVTDGALTGIGEFSPSIGAGFGAADGQAQLEAFLATGGDLSSPHAAWAAMRTAGIDPGAMAALDEALWDLLAKQAGLPLYRLLGLAKGTVPTSLTIGLNPPEVTRERVPEILRRTGAKLLKIKLGSPAGRNHDQEHFTAAAEAAAPFGVRLRVDANGGWTVNEAIAMDHWLAARGVELIEQPLPRGSEAELPRVFAARTLPIYVDESCHMSADVPALARAVDGVNVKLMKCGGITEALRIVATARAHSLKTMIGCMAESSVSISAGAALGALFDEIDLDSHLNLDPDPAQGALLLDGVVTPTEDHGHGGHLDA
ncbi:MAG: dipeptide epimerase [Acidobacteriota bacterium]